MNKSKIQRIQDSKIYKVVSNIYLACAIVVLLYFLVFKHFFIAGEIISDSMVPFLKTGDIYIAKRISASDNNLNHGDVILFDHGEVELYGKRVIAVAGDKIEFYDGQVYLNGSLLDESDYIASDVDTNPVEQYSFTVPEGKVFVMGDNRENSCDSRYWDDPYVDVNDIKAKVIYVF